LFRLAIGEQRAWSGSISCKFANVSIEPFRTTSDFVAGIDALVVPKSDDRALEQVVLAVRDNKSVVAPDDGAVAEVLGFGRHGVLFSAGNPYDLARSINRLTASWKREPFDFKGGDSIIDRTTPSEVARTFGRFYRKLDDLNPAMSKAVAS